MKKVLQKLCLEILVLALLLPLIGVMPVLAEEVWMPLYHETFDGAGIDSQHIEQVSDATYNQADGALEITSTAESNTKIYLNEDKSAATGDYLVEVTLSREYSEAGNAARVYLFNAYDVGLYVEWGDCAQGHVYIRELPSGTFHMTQTDATTYDADTNLHIKARFNSETDKASVWLNDNLVLEDLSVAHASALVKYVQMGVYPGTIKVEDVKYSKLADSPNEIITKDYAALTEGKLALAPVTSDGFLVSDLSLPTVGDNGSTISWEASPTGIVNLTNGEITKSATEQELILTATISYDGGTATEKEFTFKIPASNGEAWDVLYHETFDGTEIDTERVNQGANATYSQAGGALTINSTAESSTIIYLQEDENAATGDYTIEATLSRETISNQNAARIYLFNAYDVGLYVEWGDCGQGHVYIRELPNGIFHMAREAASNYGADNKLHIKARYNSDESKASVWLNGTLVLEDLAVAEASALVKYVQIAGYPGTIKLEDVKYSKISESPDEKIERDYNALTENSICLYPVTPEGYLLSNLDLPTRGGNGTTISWSATPTGIVDLSTGVVTQGATEQTVTLTASISCTGGTTREKSFTFKIPAATNETLVPVFSESFDGSSVSDTVKQDTTNATYTQGGGELSITTPAGKESNTIIYLKEDKSAVTGDYVIETTVSRDTVANQNATRIYLFNAYDVGLYVEWGTCSQAHVYIRELPSGTFHMESKNVSVYNAANNLRVKVRYDSDAQTATVWLNDILALNQIAVAPESALVKYVQISGYPGTVKVQDVTCSTVVYAPEEQIDRDYNTLTEELVCPSPLTENGYLVDDLNLIKRGSKGATITWSAYPSGIVDLETGLITRPETEQELTVTATVSSGDATPKTKSFSYKIPARGVSADGTPIIGNIGYFEEFDEVDPRQVVTAGITSGLVEVKNGELQMSADSSSIAITRSNIYLNKERKDVHGQFAVEFLIKKPDWSNSVMIWPTNSNRTQLTDVRYSTWGIDIYSYKNGGLQKAHTFALEELDATTRAKFTLLFNTDESTYTVYVNNRLVAEDLPYVPSGIAYIDFVKENDVFSTTIDNFKLSYCPIGDEKAALYDAEAITYDAIFADTEFKKGMIAESVILPTVGNYGSDISWTSSHPEILSTDGTVVRPAADTEVTLTATVTAGNYTQTKELTVTVLRGGDGEAVLLQMDVDSITLESILNEEPVGGALITKNLTLYTEAPLGSTISWNSSNSSLIRADGTVTRPALGTTDFYATITATVTKGDYSMEKEFLLGVLPVGYSFANPALPDVYEILYESTFRTQRNEDGSIKYNHGGANETLLLLIHGNSARGYNGRITEYDDYVEMIRETSSSEIDGALDTTFSYYLLSDKQAVTGLPAAQFVLKKTAGSGEASFAFEASNGTIAICYWKADGTFSIYHRDEDGMHFAHITESFGTEADITIMSDSESKTFSMWINGTCVVASGNPYSANASGLSSIGFYLQGENLLTMTISNIKAYQAKPFAHLMPSKDASELTEDVLRDGIPAPATGMLASNLNLPTVGKYGSTITWESSNESLIATDGTITRPSEEPNELPVTLTATISYGNFKISKSFVFNVMPLYAADASVEEKDRNYLSHENWNFFSFTDVDPDAVTTSLNLPSKGPYGSTYLWKTSDDSVITDSGRVIRPKWNQGEKTVTLTAIVLYGSAVGEKDFTFTVLPDEMISDPNHMSDEDFFGVWENGSWTNPGKFNYAANAGLSEVEAAAKTGNYTLAKEKLLAYMQSRPQSFLTTVPARNAAYADAFTLTGVHTNNYASQYAGRGMIDSHEYQQYDIPLNYISNGAIAGLKISARYNENTAIRILSTEAADPKMRPKLVMTVNGVDKAFDPIGDTVIRYGSNRYNNYSGEEEMETRFYGDFQGEGQADILLQFNLKGYYGSNPRLRFYAKIEEPYATEKEFLISTEGSEWSAETVTANNFVEYTCNFNGVPGGNHWHLVVNTEGEYHEQSVRLLNHRSAIAEYIYTGNEDYAYAVLKDWMDFVRDTQGRFDVMESYHAGHCKWVDWELTPEVIRYGAFRSSLSVSQKLTEAFVPSIDLLINSEYMTPDICTAFLKNMWHGSYELENFLNDPRNANSSGNQKLYDTDGFSKVAMYMPEFANSDAMLRKGIETMERLIHLSYFDDGAYVESTDGYSSMMFEQAINYWQLIEKSGYEFSQEAKDLLEKTAIYNCIFIGPAGIGLAWGDNGTGDRVNISPRHPLYYELTRNEEYRFVSTFGRKGVQPDWTSKYYDSTKLCTMRSDWTDNALYALMSSSGFGGHGHNDANSLTINAFQKRLLIDPGWHNYDAYDPITNYMYSVRAHNTVEINSKNQILIQGIDRTQLIPPTIKHNWVTNDEYDFYSVTFQGHEDADHRRTVTFVKPNFWIVSDLMTPYDMNKDNTYRQLWHMKRDAYLAHNDANRTIYSNFTNGANVMLASADTDATIVEDIGYQGVSWGVSGEAKYAYYLKDNVQGKQTFDTVILPYETTGNVKADRIELGVPTHDATAMKIETVVAGEKNYTYYMLDYDHVSGAVHTFDRYMTDAELAVVIEDEAGNIIEVIMNNGTYVKKADGTTILAADGVASALSFERMGNEVVIEAGEGVAATDVVLRADNTIKSVSFNGTNIVFTQTNGTISLTDSEREEDFEGDPSGDQGGIIDSGSAGGGGGGGAAGGSDKPDLPGTDKPGTDAPGTEKPGVSFNDVGGHWAENSINRMAAQGIVKGDGENFRPDAPISRAELVTMVARVLKLDLGTTDTGFDDVAEDSWYAPYVKAVLDMGIISKADNFRPNDAISREEMSKILSITSALLAGKDMQIPDDFVLDYQDNSSISEWAKLYVAFASHSGLMNGVGEGNFAPKATATRAQVATVLDRIFR